MKFTAKEAMQRLRDCYMPMTAPSDNGLTYHEVPFNELYKPVLDVLEEELNKQRMKTEEERWKIKK